MRPDQFQRILELSEQLADTFIAEADPGEWSGDGKAPADLTKQERGDRYWCKKNAVATGAVLRYTLDLIAHDDNGATRPGPAEEMMRDADLDRKISDAERRAEAAVARVMRRAQGGRHPASKT